MQNTTNNFRIKVALDTQILAYLIDKTYPSLNTFIKTLSDSQFVDVECSKFAIYEFIGIRKLEHYLRCLISETEKKGGKVNFSSALKYKGDFNSELKYVNAYEGIKNEVESELREIYDDFGISYEKINLHNNLWKPHQDLVLSTRISKEDSLLLLSSIFPNELDKEEYLVLFTNDEQFHNAFMDSSFVDLKNEIFNNHALSMPNVYNIRKCFLEETPKNHFNLTHENEDEDVINFANSLILEQIKKRNNDLLLGKVIKCACNEELKKQFLCFQLDDSKELNENIYISILTKDFEIYNHPIILSDFRCHGKITFPYKPTEEEKSKEISIKLIDDNGDNIEEELMKKITSVGNLVFIHPDSSIFDEESKVED